MSSFSSPPTHLIILCCHAIYIPLNSRSSLPPNTLLEDNWLIAPFQSSETTTFTSHLKTSLHLLFTDPSSLLAISGSKTRPETNLSEAKSYLALAEENDFWGVVDGNNGARDVEQEWEDKTTTTTKNKKREEFRNRILLEEKALDSFSNVLNSVILFWRETSRWPEKISIVSHGFKEQRFTAHHCPTLGLHSEIIEYVGIDPEYMDETHESCDKARTESVRRGEEERGLRAWMEDEWGRGDVLRGKRAGRNYWGVQQTLLDGEEERARSGIRNEIVRSEWQGRVVEEEILLDGFREVYQDLQNEKGSL